MKKKHWKWAIPAVILTVGMSWAAIMPSAVESFLPRVETVRLAQASFTPTVEAKGVISQRDGQWFATVAVKERDISSVAEGQAADISGAAFPSGVYEGRVYEIADAARQTSTVTSVETVVDVTILIEDGEGLRSGYTAQAEIATDSEHAVCLLPYSVICQDEQGEYVYVLEQGQASRRYIQTGDELPEGAEIVSGLDLRDNVILQPEKVSDGAYVLEVSA